MSSAPKNRDLEDTQESRTSMGPADTHGPLQAEPVVRPTSLHHRQSSTRSSASSYLSNDASEFGTGTGIATDSGDATPGSLSTLRPGQELSRLPSLGSVASSMSTLTERSSSRRQRKSTTAATSALDDLREERFKTQSPKDTPRNSHQTTFDPSQTVLAQHVRDVEVPATVARKFKASQVSTTLKSEDSTPMFGRAKNELTLKEQNSRIDKLSKENFDLKLKIHYLYQALQDRSEEGVKDLISKNAELQTDLVKARKEAQSTRKRIRQLERELRNREDGSSAIRTNADESEDALSSRSFRQAQLEDEIVYLRERMQSLGDDNEKLRLGEATSRVGKRQTIGPDDHIRPDTRHEMQFASLKDELTAERSKRETADQEAQELRLEVTRLKESRSPFKNLLLRRSNSNRKSQSNSPSRAPAIPSQDNSSMSGTTLAVEQLKSENSDLRRDLGAQTSMLTSRNRERERLQQEIEDLKLVQRRGDLLQPHAASVSGESILDRSVSRAHFRPTSRASAALSQSSDADREQLEAREGRLRDENAALKMRNQDLQSDLDMLTDSAEHLENLRNERDEDLRVIEEERDWAADTIDRLEEATEQREKEIHQLLTDLRAREDDSQALEVEIKDISASFRRLADASELSQGKAQELEQDVLAATGELEAMEQNLKDAQAAKERLEVQAESSQGEISFLREEQEADKIKISDLQSALNRAKMNLQDEKERLREFEALEAEAKQARDEARRLRKSLAVKDEEASAHRESLDELDSGLRHALGNLEGDRSGLVSQVKRLQRELQTSLRDLEHSQASHEEKDRQFEGQGSLVESHTAEKQRLSIMLNKEQQARKLDQAELDRARRRSPNDSARVSELERARAEDKQRLTSYQEDYDLHLREQSQLLYNLWTRLATLCGSEWVSTFHKTYEQTLPSFETINEDPASINEPLSLALDNLSHNMSSFRTRVRATEKDLFRDLSALSQSLDTRTQRLDAVEQQLAIRQNNPNGHGRNNANAPASSTINPTDLRHLKDENRLLRREIKVLKQANFALPGLPSPQRDIEHTEMAVAALEREREALSSGTSPHTNATDAHHRRPSSRRTHTTPSLRDSLDERAVLQRHHSTNEISTVNGTDTRVNGNGHLANPRLSTSDQTWLLRLKEIERRLVAEREERVLDREGARRRLEEGRGVIEGLRQKLEREKEKGRAGKLKEKGASDSMSGIGFEGDDRTRRELALDIRGRGRTRGGAGSSRAEEIV